MDAAYADTIDLVIVDDSDDAVPGRPAASANRCDRSSGSPPAIRNHRLLRRGRNGGVWFTAGRAGRS